MTEPGGVAASNVESIKAALDNPRPAPQLAQVGDTRPEVDERPPLDPSCPVRCLGITSDLTGMQRCYYLNVNGQLVGLEAGNKHGKNSLIALFGAQSGWLEIHFPQWSAPVYEGRGAAKTLVKASEIVGFDQAEASRALIEECSRRGIFDPTGRMKGRGAHPLAAGGAIFHYGDKLLIAELRADGSHKGWRWADPGLVEGDVYPTADAIPRPWHEQVDHRPAERLLGLLTTWRWKRKAVDPRLLLGWIGAAMIGGLLDWRPNIWITGSRGTGKSTLNGENKLLHQLFGRGLFTTAQTTAAGIRQTMRNSTVPVLLDEIEASTDNRRVDEIVGLARISSSGGTATRGGQDHQAHEFKLRSSFQFSSINIPDMEASDRSRLGILELLPFEAGALPPVLEDYGLPAMGRQLQRRMIDGWPRYNETLRKYHRALQLAGHDSRGADQFGALLAAGDLLLNDEVPSDEEIAHWVGLVAPNRMHEVSEAVSDHEACLQRITTYMVQARGGDERQALGSWIGKAVAAAMPSAFDDTDRHGDRLQELGLKLVNAEWHDEEKDGAGAVTKPGRWGAKAYQPHLPGFLAVAASHQALAEIYRGSKWAGIHRQSLARCDDAIEPVKVKFGRLSLTAVLVPLYAVLDDSELPQASKAIDVADWLAAQRFLHD